jgi:hypothetical protein
MLNSTIRQEKRVKPWLFWGKRTKETTHFLEGNIC